MFWLTRGWPLKLVLVTALTASAARALATRRRGEVWHTVPISHRADQN
jgi:hypothetical protein